MNIALDRRTLVTGALAATASALLPLRALAANSPATTRVGGIEVTFLSDGVLELPLSFVLPDRTAVEIEALLSPHGLPTDRLKPPLNVTLVKSDGETILIDAGSGPNFMASAGELPTALEAAGIDRDAIDRVVLTHGHPDHLWGVIDDFDELTFPNARYLISRADWDYWTDPETVSRVPEAAKGMAAGAARILGRIAERTERLEDGATVGRGMTYVATHGHTPGHMSVMIEDAGERLMVLGDAATHPVISFERPDWRYGTDHEPERAAKTRLRLLDMLATDGLVVAGYHLPRPGLGHVERKGTAYRFVAA